MKRATIAFAMTLLVVQYAYACFQMYSGPTKIRGDYLRVKVSHEDKPLSHVRISVHRAVTFTVEEVRTKRVLYGPTLASAITDESGNVSFPGISTGRYWIVMKGPSAEEAAVEFEHVRDLGLRERLRMAFVDDYCHQYTAERI